MNFGTVILGRITEKITQKHLYYVRHVGLPAGCCSTSPQDAARYRWEGIFSRWVSAAQRGFLPARSMAANILDVDLEAMRVSLQRANGGIVLFDFNAAFPSLSHKYIHTTLQAIGVPPDALNIADHLHFVGRASRRRASSIVAFCMVLRTFWGMLGMSTLEAHLTKTHLSNAKEQ